MAILTAIEENLGANDVLEVGADLAEAYDEELIVLHVMTDGDYDEEEQVRPTYTATDAERDAANKANDIALEDADIEIQTLGRLGDPVSEIIDVGRREDVRYLVIGGRRRSPTGKALFGSTTQSVLLNADLPVVTVLSE